MSKISPFLWFNSAKDVQDAIGFYTGIFKNSEVQYTTPGPDGGVMMASIVLEGQTIMMLNGGPLFKFTEAISLFVSCEDQAEVDYYWTSLLEDGGQESRCGWLKDKFGLSWQIIPKQLGEYLGDPNPEKSGKAMDAMMKMNKIIIADLQKAVVS